MIVETYRGYAIDDVGYGADSRYNVNFGGGWSGYSSVDAAKRAIDNFLPMPAPAPVNYFPSDEDVTEAQVIAYQQANPSPSPPVVPSLPAPVPLTSSIIIAAPTTGAGETGTGVLPVTIGKTFWDVFSFEDSKGKLWIVLIAVGAFLVFSRR